MTRALVLGGGGPVGIAWQIGIIAGLADAGVDVARADLIVGTSAGSVVGAQVAAGSAAIDLYDGHLDQKFRDAVADDVRDLPRPDLMPLMQFILRRPPNQMSSPELLAEMGAYALAASTVDEADFVAGIGRLIITGHGWPSRFRCTAIDAVTGVFRVWGEESDVGLPRAVAASCAVPGVYPPVTIGAARYIDGGMRSATNTDVAAGADDVLVLAVTLNPFADVMAAAARNELAGLEARKSASLIVPDAEALAAFGADLMDNSRHAEVAVAGRAQGRSEADRLRARWG